MTASPELIVAINVNRTHPRPANVLNDMYWKCAIKDVLPNRNHNTGMRYKSHKIN